VAPNWPVHRGKAATNKPNRRQVITALAREQLQREKRYALRGGVWRSDAPGSHAHDRGDLPGLRPPWRKSRGWSKRGLKRRGLTTLAARITADLTDEEDVKRVESDVVLRLVRNPEGYFSETDGDDTYMLRQDLASGKLELLPEDWETLGV